jgi:hypothetical protein
MLVTFVVVVVASRRDDELMATSGARPDMI